MDIILFEVKTNTTTKINNIRTVKVMGLYFVVIYKDGTEKRYPFKDYDFFVGG